AHRKGTCLFAAIRRTTGCSVLSWSFAGANFLACKRCGQSDCSSFSDNRSNFKTAADILHPLANTKQAKVSRLNVMRLIGWIKSLPPISNFDMHATSDLSQGYSRLSGLGVLDNIGQKLTHRTIKNQRYALGEWDVVPFIKNLNA